MVDRFTSLFLLLLITKAALLNGQDVQNRVVNGDLAAIGEFPYIVSVTLNGEHICSGFIYNKRWIITSAYCIASKEATADQLKIEVGQVSFVYVEPDEKIYDVSEVHIFDGFDLSTRLNDIALLSVAGDAIVFGTNVNFIPINEVQEDSPTALIMGWGATQPGGIISTKLHMLEISMNGDCYVYGPVFNTDSVICAGSVDDKGGPCTYDEGSPLVQNGMAVGMMSYQRNCWTDPFFSAIYTRLIVYREWLEMVAGTQPPISKRL